MASIPARITLPETARKGEIVEIRVLARHIMERAVDAAGLVPRPRKIIHTFRASMNGEELVRIELSPGIAANPYLVFTTVATESGDIVFEWLEDGGTVYRREARLTVT